MADLNSLVQAFTSQASQPSEPLPWQQQLLEQVDPAKAKRQNIARAIQRASAALASTPGNFGTGLAAAASAGSGAYLDGRDASEAQRIQAMRQIDEANRAQKDRDLSRLSQAIGVQSGYENTQYARGRDAISDNRYTQEKTYQKTQDDRNFGIRQQQANSMDSYRRQRNEIAAAKAGIDGQIGRVPGTKGMLTANQRNQAITAINRFANDFEQRRLEEIDADYSLTPEEKAAAKVNVSTEKNDYKRSLMQEYQLETASPQVMDPNQTPAPGRTDKGAPAAKPAPDVALQQAREAISRGADPEAVRQRLIQNGYDASGL